MLLLATAAAPGARLGTGRRHDHRLRLDDHRGGLRNNYRSGNDRRCRDLLDWLKRGRRHLLDGRLNNRLGLDSLYRLHNRLDGLDRLRNRSRGRFWLNKRLRDVLQQLGRRRTGGD